jgi:hypothetical protein
MHPRIVCKKHDVADRIIYPLQVRDATTGLTALETYVETYKQPPVGLAAFPLLRRAEALERLLPAKTAPPPPPPPPAGKAKGKLPPPPPPLACASCQIQYSPMWHPAGDGSGAKTCHRCFCREAPPPSPPPLPPQQLSAPAPVEGPPPIA